MLDIKNLRVGELKSNSYVVGNDKECILIDAGSERERDLQITRKAIGTRKLHAIIITHAHFDHIDGAHCFDVPVFLHKEDLANIKEHNIISKAFTGKELTLPKELKELKEHMTFGALTFTVIHTPGHTKGGVCLLFDNCIFTGDTLFKGTYGRTDVGGNKQDIMTSLHKLATLPNTLTVYPGHGLPTTIGNEKDWIENMQEE
jgi:hydroxyacylglutathione hydrolase